MSQVEDRVASHLSSLNSAQREAVTFADEAPLLVIAGAGSGKTNTLAHRVAHLLLGRADPERILLLTFSRRAAIEMTRRAERIIRMATQSNARRLGSTRSAPGIIRWSGTFHAVANRLLRLHAHSIGLDPSFTVLDRSDSADLLNLVRNELGLAKKARRFPKKSTCLAIYSRAVNEQKPLELCLEQAFPWCRDWAEQLRNLFRGYVEAKQARRVVDYDDLLLYWYHLMQEPALARRVGKRFDHVLVDEYQDTNALQAAILLALKPAGVGLTVVGDDAQAIYGFRAATVRNILDFPDQFPVAAKIVTLAENYRSTQPILDAANAVIEQCPERYVKKLFSRRAARSKPILATVEDEICQVDYVIEHILANREEGTDLRHQAVLFRTAHHSDALEVELGRRNIPFVKYGGLKFLEAAHVKDVLCVLRWAENPSDVIAAFRVLQLLPGIGPAAAKRIIEHIHSHEGNLKALNTASPPAAARHHWPLTCELFSHLCNPATEWRGQVHMVKTWYEPLLEQAHDNAQVRLGDIEQLDQISAEYPSRERFLTELTLDPPESSGDLAGPPLLDEDYLILSTIHSAKGQEWDAVFILNCTDGCIPSDMATGDREQIEEERRLLYVAMTRAKNQLHLMHPLRMFVREQRRHGDRHVYTPISRFLSEGTQKRFHRVSRGRSVAALEELAASERIDARVDVAAKLRGMW
ncbi:MAG: ATP-dependent helicase [Proteobacteria bacterium]|nr:ATP-dependent helicase [Pseudomonadota bacterium]